jgi:1-acyl-sn-glycerol-3-phosphate acyltransferase
MNPLWRPRSACGPDCLPAGGDTPVSRTRQTGRLAALFAVLVAGVGLVVLLPLLPSAGRHRAVRTWARGLLRAVGVRLVVRGRPPQRRALLVANHVSWLDIIAVVAVSPARLVAKHEVRRWPLVGVLAALGRTIFVDRSRPRTLPDTVAEVATVLRAGAVVAVFPEATTWCGTRSSRAAAPDCADAVHFRPAMFQAAIDAGAGVVPLSLHYRSGPAGTGTTAAAFLGDESLWRSLRRVVAVPALSVSLTAAPVLHPDTGATRVRLARVAESVVRLAPPPPGATPRLVAPARSLPASLPVTPPRPCAEQPSIDLAA